MSSDTSITSRRFFWLVLFGIIFILCFKKISNYDIWWHLAAARYSFLNGEILTKDIFSFTNYGMSWVNSEWLSGLFFYLFFLAGGFIGLLVFKALTVLAVFFMVFKLMEPAKRHSVVALLITWLAFIGAFARFSLRPHIIFYLFLLMQLYLITIYQKRQKILFLLPALAVLALTWANSHGSAFYSLIVIGAFMAELVFQGRVKGKTMRGYLVMAATFFLVILINPHFYDIYFYPFRAFSHTLQLGYITEYKRVSLNDLLGPLGIFTALGPVVIYQLFRRKSYANLLLLIFFASTAFRYSRFLAVFFLVAAPIYVNFLPVSFLVKRKKVAAAFFCLMIAAGLFYLKPQLYAGRQLNLGLGVKWRMFPRAAKNFIALNLADRNGANEYGWGGYLIWALPGKKVFIDGRFADPELFEDYLAMTQSIQGLNRVAEKYQLDYVLIARLNAPEPKKVSLLFDRRNWGIVLWDNASYLFLKRTEANKSLLDRYEYRLFNPLTTNLKSLPALIKNEKNRPQLKKELQQAYQTDSSNQKAALALGTYYQLTQNRRLLSHWQKFTRENPRVSGGWYHLGVAYEQQNNPGQAATAYQKALRNQPDFKAARQRLTALKF